MKLHSREEILDSASNSFDMGSDPSSWLSGKQAILGLNFAEAEPAATDGGEGVTV